jgi:hypothetical protein
MSIPPAKILEFTESLITFSLHHKIISNKIISRFLNNLKSSIQNNTSVFFKRPQILSENSEETFNPILYKKFLNANVIDFSRNGFQIDFRELLVNNLSFGNPIGCLMLCEAALNQDQNAFSPEDLSELFVYLSIFGVVNDSINPVIKRGLTVLLQKITEDSSSGNYQDNLNDPQSNCLFDGTLKAEFWVASLYELHISTSDSRNLLFQALYHYVLKYADYSQSSRLLRRIINWMAREMKPKTLEFLYILQSVNFLYHFNKGLDGEEDFFTALENKSTVYFAKQIFNSVLFFVRNYLVKVQKEKKEPIVVAFLAKGNFNVDQFKGEELENGILLLFREILKKLAKEGDHQKARGLFVKGKEKAIGEVMQVVDLMVNSQLKLSE